MPKVIVFVGLPGSGKSYTIAKKFTTYKMFSSDYYRKLICGDENCQTRNQEVFTQLYKDLRDCLIAGYDVVFDATNVTRKDRARIFNQLNGIPNIVFEAYVMRTPIDVCINQDAQRNRVVGEDMIKKSLYKFEFPQRFEGFSQITIDDRTYADRKSATQILQLMQKWDQENPHHIHNLYDHCYKLASQFTPLSVSWYAGIFHDVGKLFTKQYDDQKIAHYYNHDCVGTYFILSELLDYFKSESKIFIEQLLFLVNYHMKGHKDFRTDKYRKLFGEDLYQNLIMFADADMLASGTDSIHLEIIKWVKEDKLTLKQIRDKSEYGALIAKEMQFKRDLEQSCKL